MHDVIRESDLKIFRRDTRILEHRHALANFSQTSGLLHELDMIITVDTSVAHLAAAIGKPTWILLPWVPDFRWLLDRPDSPWYPSVRLFRQPARDDWAPVLEAVRSALMENLPAPNSI